MLKCLKDEVCRWLRGHSQGLALDSEEKKNSQRFKHNVPQGAVTEVF